MVAEKKTNLFSLMEQFNSEDKCREFLEELRWPGGLACPRCGGMTISRIKDRHQFDCDSCRYQFSVTAGTVLQDSKLPLSKWFIATFLLCEAKKGMSANQLKRTIGGTYRTSWYLSHRIRWAMNEVENKPLRGIVEADETFIGGKQRYHRVDDQDRIPGPDPAKPKAIVLGAVERGGRVHLRVAPDRTKKTIQAFLREVVHDEAAAVYTDEFPSYRGIGDANTRHETVNHRAEEWVRGDVHSNTAESVWSLVHRAIVGSYHHVSVKHLQAYLDEVEFKFNNRDNPSIFRETLRVLITADPLTYGKLTSE